VSQLSQPPANIAHAVIMGWIEQGASVLDLGCGDGELLTRLIEEKQVRAQGIEISEDTIHQCVARGLSVFQEDIDSGLSAYLDESFDYVILNQTFQQVKKPEFVLKEALRVGKKVIVGFPNFLYITARFQMFFGGKVPVTPSLPYEWYDTPNLHFLSIADFVEYCKKRKIQIEQTAFIGKNKKVKLFPNLFAEIGLFLLSK
jgi:methionine biosynthesis protein MetW